MSCACAGLSCTIRLGIIITVAPCRHTPAASNRWVLAASVSGETLAAGTQRLEAAGVCLQGQQQGQGLIQGQVLPLCVALLQGVLQPHAQGVRMLTGIWEGDRNSGYRGKKSNTERLLKGPPEWYAGVRHQKKGGQTEVWGRIG